MVHSMAEIRHMSSTCVHERKRLPWFTFHPGCSHSEAPQPGCSQQFMVTRMLLDMLVATPACNKISKVNYYAPTLAVK